MRVDYIGTHTVTVSKSLAETHVRNQSVSDSGAAFLAHFVAISITMVTVFCFLYYFKGTIDGKY